MNYYTLNLFKAWTIPSYFIFCRVDYLLDCEFFYLFACTVKFLLGLGFELFGCAGEIWSFVRALFCVRIFCDKRVYPTVLSLSLCAISHLYISPTTPKFKQNHQRVVPNHWKRFNIKEIISKISISIWLQKTFQHCWFNQCNQTISFFIGKNYKKCRIVQL